MAGNTAHVQAVQNITNRQPMPAKAPGSGRVTFLR
jgi:hypothetical protein